MRKVISNFFVAIVCALLGFMLTYEFKLLSIEDKEVALSNGAGTGNEISMEKEILLKQKEELKKKNSELSMQLRKYEEIENNQEELNQEVSKQLKNVRFLMGDTDIKGPGVIITLIPSSTVLNNDSSDLSIKDEELVYLINELNFAGAESIAINDKRITAQSSIKNLTGNILLINDEAISSKQRITIKAIGNKEKLDGALNFPMTLEYRNLNFYDKRIEPTDNVTIPKYNKSYKSGYITTKIN